MAITLARIDERLVHGQVTYSWSVAYDVDTIIVVDDLSAKDEMQRMLIGMAIAKDKNGQLFTVDEAIQYFKDGRDLNEKVFLVAKDPDVYLRLVKGGVNIKSINVGGMYYKLGRKQLTKSIYADEKQIGIFKELQALGVKSEVRTSPNDKSSDICSLC